MRFGFVTDDPIQDPREAIELALGWGVKDFEIRNVNGVRFPRHQDGTLEQLARLREEYGIRYTAVSPGFFKCHLTDRQHIDYALGEGLDIAMEFMARCEVHLLVCFGFEMATGTDAEAVDHLKCLADRLQPNGFQAAVENETHCKFDVPERIADLLRRVGRPGVGANWDPGNLKQFAPDGFPTGYELVKPFILNVHAKDVTVMPDGSTEWRPIGEGLCDWQGQMTALENDRIVDHVTIESHCGPPEKVGRHNLRRLESYLATQ